MCDTGPLPQKRFQLQMKAALFNPLHPNISRDILHTFFYTFPMVLIRRICLTIKIISFILVALMRDSGVIL